MDLSVKDVTDPGAIAGGKGRLDPRVLFPRKRGGYDAAEWDRRIKGYLADAEAKVATLDEDEQNAPGKAWVEYRTYDAVLQRNAALPSSIDAVNEGSASTSADQRALIKELRDQALAEFTALVAAAADEDDEDEFTIVRSFR